MKVQSSFPFLAVAFVMSAAFPASAQESRTHREQFEADKTQATITDKISGRESVLFKLNAREGQFLTVSLRPDNQSAEFNVYIPGQGPSDAAMFISATGGREYRGQLYKTGEAR